MYHPRISTRCLHSSHFRKQADSIVRSTATVELEEGSDSEDDIKVCSRVAACLAHTTSQCTLLPLRLLAPIC